MLESETIKRRVGRPKSLNIIEITKDAMFLFWDKGIQGVSFNEVARATGVSKPSLYRYFGDEDGLRAATVELYSELLMSDIRKALASENSFRGSLNAYFEAMMERNLTKEIPSGCLILDVNIQIENHGHKTVKAVKDMSQLYTKILIDLCCKASSTNELNSNINPKEASLFIMSQTFGLTTLASAGLGRDQLKTVYSNTIERVCA